jgi:hypothetical protein
MTITEKYAAREQYVRKIAKKHRDEFWNRMTTEVELKWGGQPYLRFRIFKSDGEWITVRHTARRGFAADVLGLEYEIQGERENRAPTREASLNWIALHWQDVVDKMMAAECLHDDEPPQRCRSQWQQMDSQPVIRCARREGHPGWHYNTREQRQWEGDTEC